MLIVKISFPGAGHYQGKLCLYQPISQVPHEGTAGFHSGVKAMSAFRSRPNRPTAAGLIGTITDS